MFFYKLISWKHHFAGSYIRAACQLPWQNRTIVSVDLKFCCNHRSVDGAEPEHGEGGGVMAFVGKHKLN